MGGAAEQAHQVKRVLDLERLVDNTVLTERRHREGVGLGDEAVMVASEVVTNNLLRGFRDMSRVAGQVAGPSPDPD